MSAKGGNNNNGGGVGHINGGGGIPASSRKMVQNLKEIVKDMSDLEIYATLKDSNMDPDEAVNRLLSQDPFLEVKKTKRDKKKDTVTTATSNDYYSRSRSSTTTRPVPPPPRKLAPKKEYRNGTLATAYNVNSNQPLPYRSAESVGVFDGLPSLSSQDAPLQQSPWMVNTGQRSMADIVKMGRPQVAGNIPSNNQQSRGSKVSEINSDQGFSINQQGDEWPYVEHQSGGYEWPSVEHQSGVNEWPSVEHQSGVNEWPSVEHQSGVNEWPSSTDHQSAVNKWPVEHHQPTVSVSTVVDAIPNSEYHTKLSDFGETDWQHKTYDNEYVAEEVPVNKLDNVGSASVSTKSKLEDKHESNLYRDNNSHQPHQHPLDNNEVEAAAVSSVAANFEDLNLHAEDQGTECEEESPSVVIPDHLQLHNPECLNLSFGSFGSAKNASLSESEPHASRPMKTNVEDTSEEPSVSIIGSSDARNPDYYGDEHVTTSSDGNLVHRTAVGAGTYEHSSIPQTEVLKSEPHEPVQENQYPFASSSHVYTYEKAQQTDAAFPHSQTGSHLQDLSPFSSVMQAYTNSLPSALLDSSVQLARESIQYSPFPGQQPMAAKYNNIASSIGGPTITMSEPLRANSISTPQPNPQPHAGANVATGQALAQQLGVHPYSQPTLPLGHYANMIGYPFLPQTYSYMPSAYQQAFAQNSTYHQSLAALLPQYKNSNTVSSMSQSAALPPGYGYGSSTSIPGGNFPLNQPAAPTSTTIGYEDVLNSQYKDSNHMISLQQSENSPTWHHGLGSRTMPAAPPSAYYSIQGQNQQAGGFRQSQQQQQPSQHFGPLGYPNIYQSQGGISLEHQQQQLQQLQQQLQQNPMEASLAGSQNQQSKQSQQLWQNSY